MCHSSLSSKSTGIGAPDLAEAAVLPAGFAREDQASGRIDHLPEVGDPRSAILFQIRPAGQRGRRLVHRLRKSVGFSGTALLNFGSVGAQACSLGREPQGRETRIPESPVGATAAHRAEETAVAPTGLWVCFSSPSWGSRPRLHAVAPCGAKPNSASSGRWHKRCIYMETQAG